MATISPNVLTLADWAKRRDPDSKAARIVEMLSQDNAILDDMPWKECNMTASHRTTVRTGLPDVAWRLLNQGVQPSKSRTAQIDEATGMLEAWSEVDVELANLEADQAAFRLSEAAAFIEAMGQEHASTLFYGNSSVSPEEFTGLSARYSSLSAANAQNIINGGGSGSDNSSIWLVGWGEQTVHGIYPKGSAAGLNHNDLGQQVVETTNGIGGSRMLAYRDQFTWKCGIALKDWRSTVRIANLDISNIVAKSSAADLTELMIRAKYRLPTVKNGGKMKPVFYANRTIVEFLDIQRRDDVQLGGQLNYREVDGVEIMHFRGIPIKVCDALLETEAAVV